MMRISLMASSWGKAKRAFASSLVIQQIPPEITMQGIKVDALLLTVIEIGVSLFGAAFGVAHKDPLCDVRSYVT
jgi:hypothetical protein